MTKIDRSRPAFRRQGRATEDIAGNDIPPEMRVPPRPAAIPRADLRKMADAAVAGFTGKITKAPPIDPATMTPKRHPMRRR